MEYVINIRDDMNDDERRNVYQQLKIILSEIGVPMENGYEGALVWKNQEYLKKLVSVTGKKGYFNMENIGND